MFSCKAVSLHNAATGLFACCRRGQRPLYQIMGEKLPAPVRIMRYSQFELERIYAHSRRENCPRRENIFEKLDAATRHSHGLGNGPVVGRPLRMRLAFREAADLITSGL